MTPTAHSAPNDEPPLRLAVWSGPRSLAAPLMRSFAQLPGCVVLDEPLYAAFLARTGARHPMRERILAEGEPALDRAIARCLAPAPGARLIYQKHMTRHLPEGADLEWTDALTNVFLIRDPARVLASYVAKGIVPELWELGIHQQLEMFERASDILGRACPVIDAEDLRADPERALRALCARVGLTFDERMLSWAPGRRAYEGPWGAFWYDALEESTGFVGPSAPPAELSDDAAELAEACRPAYRTLRAHAL
ncbi:HAD family hydrolase [Oceanicella actignis]|uniref:sulfotransferase-like domain-containing protein n=1 Tax=Oceanicella actignis TaxID=1189325 RepID=UPI00125A70A0|nr:HAD family hydrolase [Oceanicella actignis]TYO90037.1 hypothetical protein LY05_01235 [Oceanicella actignis]